MKTKAIGVKRGPRMHEPSQRLNVVIRESTFEILRRHSVTTGYTPGALARRAIERSIARGDLEGDELSQSVLYGPPPVAPIMSETFWSAFSALQKENQEHGAILQDRIALKEERIAQMHGWISEYTSTMRRLEERIAELETEKKKKGQAIKPDP